MLYVFPPSAECHISEKGKGLLVRQVCWFSAPKSQRVDLAFVFNLMDLHKSAKFVTRKESQGVRVIYEYPRCWLDAVLGKAK